MTIKQFLSHGLEILLLCDTLTSPLKGSEISKRMRYGQSKTYRLARTLIKYGLLQENL
jgi:DNA-binding IclR family transcriptional regulator